MLAQNKIQHKIRIQSQSKSLVWSQWKSSEAIGNHNVGIIVKVSTFDDIVSKKDLHIFPWIPNIQRITVPYTPLSAVACTDLYLETVCSK